MAVPTVVVIGLVGVGLYFFVLRSVSMFADEQIKEALTDIASEVYDICDEKFSELMQSGKMDDHRAVTIKKAFTLGAIEDFLARNNVGCRLLDAGKEELLRVQIDSDLLDAIARYPEEGPVFKIDYQGKKMYLYHLAFKPWGMACRSDQGYGGLRAADFKG